MSNRGGGFPKKQTGARWPLFPSFERCVTQPSASSVSLCFVACPFYDRARRRKGVLSEIFQGKLGRWKCQPRRTGKRHFTRRERIGKPNVGQTSSLYYYMKGFVRVNCLPAPLPPPCILLDAGPRKNQRLDCSPPGGNEQPPSVDTPGF